MAADASPITSTSLQLVLPGDPQLLRIVRLVASGLASLTDLGLDAVEEVRAAADELVSTLMESSKGEAVTLTLSLEADRLRLEARAPLAGGGALEVDPITDQILDKVASNHSWATADGIATGVVERDLS
ncbi:MAG TPA: hypothetical protein VJ804_00290 [Acidimicrobiales bacterium]|nr:hypothetical protein [Acidimicrobiales bacterium]